MSIGIYLSFPFSRHPAQDLEWGEYFYLKKLVREYLASLLQEVKSSPFQKHNVSSLLFGAGDWGLVWPNPFQELIGAVKKKFRLTSQAEFTLEVSPANLNFKKIRLFRQIGVNRVSLNLFRFNFPVMEKSVSNLKKAGIKNFNFDLYFSKPGQTLSNWKRELSGAVSLEPAHLSLYSYGSASKQQHLKRELYSFAQDFLVKNNYKQYEICHFCRPGFESKQNLLYWQRKNFLGFGAGAASLWNNTRRQNPEKLQTYFKSIQSGKNLAISTKRLTEAEVRDELIYYALRQTDGLDLDRFRRAYGYDPYTSKKQIIDGLIANGYFSRKANRLALTKEAYLSADELISKLF